jgi:hypothetical protein
LPACQYGDKNTAVQKTAVARAASTSSDLSFATPRDIGWPRNVPCRLADEAKDNQRLADLITHGKNRCLLTLANCWRRAPRPALSRSCWGQFQGHCWGQSPFRNWRCCLYLGFSCGEVAERLKRRFANRRSAFRPSSFFIANLSVSITSPSERFGCRWLRNSSFPSCQGRLRGHYAGRFATFDTLAASARALTIQHAAVKRISSPCT